MIILTHTTDNLSYTLHDDLQNLYIRTDKHEEEEVEEEEEEEDADNQATSEGTIVIQNFASPRTLRARTIGHS